MPESRKNRRADRTNPLLAQALKGDREAFHQLFARDLPALERFVHRELRYYQNLGALEHGMLDERDIVDQVYIAAQSNFKSKPPTLSLRGWLYYLASHILQQHARNQERADTPRLPLELTLSAPSSDNVDTELWEFYQPDDVPNLADTLSDPSALDPAELVAQRETTREIEEKINALPPELRQALVLRVVEGLSLQEIATLTGREPEALREAIRAAREQLRRSGADLL